jgi:hypothetical protein
MKAGGGPENGRNGGLFYFPWGHIGTGHQTLQLAEECCCRFAADAAGSVCVDNLWFVVPTRHLGK